MDPFFCVGGFGCLLVGALLAGVPVLIWRIAQSPAPPRPGAGPTNGSA